MKINFLLYILLSGIFFRGELVAQSRRMVTINDAWEFTKDQVRPDGTGGGEIRWEKISLPHSWNKTDVMDDEPGYYRGEAWYRRRFSLEKSARARQLYIRFEGANQVATVYVNGKWAGTHTGGYTSFQLPLNSLLNYDTVANSNEVLVKVDNKQHQQVAPLSADFTFFGGIYRDAWLVNLSDVHFSMNNNGSAGIFISTPSVSDRQATVRIKGSITNKQHKTVKVKLHSVVTDKEGNMVQKVHSALTLSSDTDLPFDITLPPISNPRLWSPDNPYLYSIKTIIRDASTDNVLDELVHPLGLRWFRFDAAEGFFINGKHLKLVGASRHQDRPGMGNAVPDALARKDIEWLKKMGGNFLRIAHYPQDPAVLEACDRLGIITSVEIPVVNEITESDSFYNNCANMQVEMIRQHYNHPSVVIWCYMNEVLLRPHFNDDKERQKMYFSHITTLAARLDSITRAEDPSRYTMMAHHGDFDKYKNTGLVDIPMIVGWNLYSGWYGGDVKNFPAFLDKHRHQFPSKPIVVAEYGADADPRIRSFHPVRFDKSIEYTNQFHQYYINEMMKRPFVAAAMIWNLADFNSETREETMPHINNKGILTWNRSPKDPFYLYQAVLAKEPFIKIANAGWPQRAGRADSNRAVCFQPLQVATNLDSVELLLNGISLGHKKPVTGLCEFVVPFVHGNNTLEARGERAGEMHSDYSGVQFTLHPYQLKNARSFLPLNILLGGDRYFYDEILDEVWIPDQAYQQDSWGCIGGEAYKIPGNNRLPYGSDKDIRGTNNDPVYQTQQTGIKEYRLDVPPGQYELTLHFAELEGVAAKDLPYNLSNTSSTSLRQSRRFHVYINGELFLENFNIAAEVGLASALAKKIFVSALNEGIRISFIPLSGQPVLNALQVRKMY